MSEENVLIPKTRYENLLARSKIAQDNDKGVTPKKLGTAQQLQEPQKSPKTESQSETVEVESETMQNKPAVISEQGRTREEIILNHGDLLPPGTNPLLNELRQDFPMKKSLSKPAKKRNYKISHSPIPTKTKKASKSSKTSQNKVLKGINWISFS